MRVCYTILLFLLCAVLPAHAQQDYRQLWADVYRQAKADKPKNEIALLGRISDKALTENNYGQLLTAGLLRLSLVRQTYGDDSIVSVRQQLEQRKREVKTAHPALAAVYACALGQKGEAMADPALLARTRDTSLSPMLIPGAKVFGGDMLSAVAWQTGQYQKAHDYYEQAGNRPAALATDLWMVPTDGKRRTVQWCDSLLAKYGDLRESQLVTAVKARQLGDSAAVVLADSTLRQWEGDTSDYGNQLRNIKSAAETPSLSISLNGKHVHSKDKPWLHLESANLSKADVSVYGTKKGRRSSKPLWHATRRFNKGTIWHPAADSLQLPQLAYGAYKVVARAQGVKPVTLGYIVSDLNVTVNPASAKTVRMRVIDTRTGRPVPGAKIAIGGEDDNPTGDDDNETAADDEEENDAADGDTDFAVADTAEYDMDEAVVDTIASEPSVHGVFTTDARGETVVPCDDTVMEVRPFTENDRWRESTMVYPGETEPASPCQLLLNAYTDRALYRPGDTARVAAVAFVRRPGHRRKALSHMPMHLLLYNNSDPQHAIDSIDVTTDDYGTAYCDIPLTGKLATGNEYRGWMEPQWKADGAVARLEQLTGRPLSKHTDDINIDEDGLSFRIEEYKLSSLQVRLRTSPAHYMPGDTVTVRGRAYLLSGAPVAGARVEAIGDSALFTDSNGMFTAHIALPKAADKHVRHYLEKVYAVTAPDGQQSKAYVHLSYSNQKAFLSSDIYNIYRDDARGYFRDSLLAVNCLLSDAQGNKVQGKVSWQLDDGTKGEMAANRQGFIPLKTLQAGQHTLKLWGEGDTLATVISVIDPVARHLSRPVFFWVAASDDAFSDNGQPVTIQMGTTEKGLTLYYELRSADSLIERGSMALSDTVVTRALLYNRDLYGGGITLSVAAFGQGKTDSYDIKLPYKEPTAALRAQWELPDSVAEPGQRQAWRLRVTRPTGLPADAQAMVTLYDRALDLITDNTWDSNWYFSDDLPTGYTETFDNDKITNSEEGRPKLLTVPDVRPAIFADGLILLQADARTVAYRMGGWTLERQGKGKPGYCHGIVYDPSGDVLMGAALKTSQGAKGVTDIDGTFSIPVKGTAQITASYVGYEPTTVTVTSGQPVVICLSYDSNQLEEVVALDTLAQPDKFAAPVIKRDAELKSEYRNYTATKSKNLTAYNHGRMAENGAGNGTRVRRNFRTLALWAPATVTGSDGMATFDFTMPDNVTTWRLQGLVHDREGAVASLDTTVQSRLTLMVDDNLPRFLRRGDKALLPLTVSNMGEDRLKGTLGVQAVGKGKTLTDKAYKFNLQPSALKAFITPLHVPADSLLQSITVQAGASAGGHGDGMEKTIPIVPDKERVPMVRTVSRPAAEAMREALTEMDSVRGSDALSLASKVYSAYMLNGLNDSVDEQETLHDAGTPLGALRRLRRADGSFSWWPGMPASRSVTVTVAEMLAPLAGDISEIEQLLQPATAKLAAWLAEDARQLEKKGAAACDLEEAFHILYTLSLMPEMAAKGAEASKKARKQLLDYAESHGSDLTILGKARVATALYQDGRHEAARSMMESLRQYAVTSPELGTYFDSPKAYYSWRDYKIPTVTAAIHALTLIEPDDTALLTGMKRWLVEEKKTQKWDTPVVTADAVGAFLTGPFPQRVAWPVVTGWHEAAASTLPQVSNGLRVSRIIAPADSTRRALRTGDRVTAIIKVRADRDLDFVRITDRRPACLMPASQFSGYDWRLGCYVRPADEQTDYYFETMPKGDYTLTTDYILDRPGTYHAGAVRAVCEYNPAFMGRNSQTLSVSVDK